jgi:nonribosomal peptide synthetase DhbF
LDDGRRTRSDLEVLLPIRPAGTSRPLFCIHPVAGLSWAYSRLIRHIPADHPIFALQARSLSGTEPFPDTLQGMASDYLNIIREIQPVGPYNLLGWSFGGLVAHAMATQLQSHGEQVALLALLDSYPFEPQNEVESDVTEVISSGAPSSSLRQLLESLRREGDMHWALENNDYEVVAATYRNNVRIMKDHVPVRFNGDALLFTASESGNIPPFESWRPFVTELKVHVVHCTHDSMMDARPAESIGKTIAAELGKQQANYWRTK